MTPAEFVSFAGRLTAMGAGGEAAIRTIAGRAYYGAFHTALEYLTDLGFTVPTNANAHGVVRQYLNGSAHAEACCVARLLQDLHSHRIHADYRLQDSRFRSFGTARIHVENAVEVQVLLEQCRREPARTQVIDGINAYLARLN